MTVRLFTLIQSELIKKGLNEVVDENGNLIYFDDDKQFTNKILMYDDEVSKIIDDLFNGLSLSNIENDYHFKKVFVYHFLNRRINRQTKEAFQFQLLSTFLSQENYINAVYNDLDKYISQQSDNKQTNNQNNTQTATSVSNNDSRSAYANLPQSNVNLDVDNTNMNTADDNTVSRSKQSSENTNKNETTGDNTTVSNQFKLDELVKSSSLFKNILDVFDVNCFMQIF